MKSPPQMFEGISEKGINLHVNFFFLLSDLKYTFSLNESYSCIEKFYNNKRQKYWFFYFHENLRFLTKRIARETEYRPMYNSKTKWTIYYAQCTEDQECI